MLRSLSLARPATRQWPASRPSTISINIPSTTSHHASYNFHTTARLQKRRSPLANKVDKRITLIRYHLQHPKLPRVLHLSRNRHLRHWTIHRAYQRLRTIQRESREVELERQFQSMQAACEALRLVGEDGLAVTDRTFKGLPLGARDPSNVVVERAAKEGQKSGQVHVDVKAAAEQQQYVGLLYRHAMMKTGVWQGVPIEYARMQTDTPSRDGWDHNWKRQTEV